MYNDPFASCDLQNHKIGIFLQTPDDDARDLIISLVEAYLPITVSDKCDRLTVVRAPMYTRRSKGAPRLAVQSRWTTLFHHHILRLDSEI